MNLLLGEIENAEGEAAVQFMQLKASSPASWIRHTKCFVAPLLPGLAMADRMTLYMSPGFLVPQFHHL